MKNQRGREVIKIYQSHFIGWFMLSFSLGVATTMAYIASHYTLTSWN